jgi:asparagine synthase (glutamine-hydrolysing)
VPRSARRVAAEGGRVLALVAPHRQTRRLERFLTESTADPARQYARWMMHIDPELRRELLTPELLAATADDGDAIVEQLYASSDAPTLVERSVDTDVRSYLPDDLLVKVDIAAMAHGLEGRSPFLDHELMEFAASLPLRFKLRQRTKKYLPKQLAARRLPPELLSLPKKGFGVPIDHWFRRDLGAFAKDLLYSTTAQSRGYFRRPVIERLFAEHERGTRHWHYQLWNLLMLELWLQMFIDARPTAPPARVRLAPTASAA